MDEFGLKISAYALIDSDFHLFEFTEKSSGPSDVKLLQVIVKVHNEKKILVYFIGF